MLTDVIMSGRTVRVDWKVCANMRFRDAYCGYARLPFGHPWRVLEDWEIPVDVHGGITYGPDENGWIGFDMMHAGDSLVTVDGHSLDDDLKLFAIEYGLPEPSITRRTVGDAIDETMSLAAQADKALETDVA